MQDQITGASQETYIHEKESLLEITTRKNQETQNVTTDEDEITSAKKQKSKIKSNNKGYHWKTKKNVANSLNYRVMSNHSTIQER